MPLLKNYAWAVGLLAGSIGIAQAESLYQVDTQVLSAITLYDQELFENGLVTVKPSVGADAEGDLFALDKCLWSVNVSFSSDSVIFEPGKMICVGPNQEVLETTPVGAIEPFGECVDAACSSYQVHGDYEFKMTLSNPIALSLQPRNERK